MAWTLAIPVSGVVVTPPLPASGTPINNTSGKTVTVFLTAGLGAITAIAINAVVVSGLTVGAGLLSPPIRFAAGASMTLTYTGSPNWQWVA
jgi:hypothetical protein